MLKSIEDICENTNIGSRVIHPRKVGKNYEYYEKEFNEFFKSLRGIIPSMANTIKTQQEYDYLRREWLLAFVNSGLTLNQIESGLQVARQKNTNFIPSVGTFIEWCKEGSIIALGLPSVDQVMKEFRTYSAEIGFSCQTAEQFPWSKPVMYWIVTDLRKHMRQYNQSEYEIEQRAALLINKWAKKLSNGEVVPEIRVQIENKPKPAVKTQYYETQDVKDMWERIRAKRSRKNG